MQKTSAKIRNAAGIHCRPTALICKEALQYGGTIQVTGPSGVPCVLGSVLNLMVLGLLQGHEVEIQVEGPDETATLERFKELFETHFDFQPEGK